MPGTIRMNHTPVEVLRKAEMQDIVFQSLKDDDSPRHYLSACNHNIG
jgi:hypothetical protein